MSLRGQQQALLRQLGCTEMQGYLFSAPKPAAEVRKLFAVAAVTAVGDADTAAIRAAS